MNDEIRNHDATGFEAGLTTEPEWSEVADMIPTRVRTIAYAATATVGVLAFGAAEIVPLWAPEAADAVAQTVSRVLAVVAVVTGWLGTAYRPTR